MSRSLSATGWSAGATVLHLHRLLGGLGGRRGGGRSGGGAAVAASLALAAGAVTISAGLRVGGLCGRGGLSRLLDRLGRVRHRGGGVDLEIADGRRRNVGRFGTRDCCVDREFGGAGARRVDWAASAEVADTVRKVAATAISTRSNPARFVEQSRIVTPPWAKLPRHGTVVRYRSSRLAREAPARSVSQSYACTQRFKRRRYMCPFHAASAMRDNSRQTDLKLPVCIRVARFCHAPRLLSVTAKPRFKSSERSMSLVCRDLCHAGAIIAHRRSLSPRLSQRPARRLRPGRWRRPHRACGRAWSGRS